jgi:hypothetical protein
MFCPPPPDSTPACAAPGSTAPGNSSRWLAPCSPPSQTAWQPTGAFALSRACPTASSKRLLKGPCSAIDPPTRCVGRGQGLHPVQLDHHSRLVPAPYQIADSPLHHLVSSIASVAAAQRDNALVSALAANPNPQCLSLFINHLLIHAITGSAVDSRPVWVSHNPLSLPSVC